MWMDRGIVFVYIAILVGMGLRGGKHVKSVSDFTASSGKYGTPIIFATLAASYIGGGYSSGNAAKAFENGISTTCTLFGFSLAMVLIGKFLVPGVKRFEGLSSVGGIIGQSYGRGARILTGVFSFLCCAGVVGAQIESIGMVFHVLLGVERHVGAILGCAIVLVYSTVGGMQSVIAADIVQFVLLTVGMPLLLFMGLHAAGGLPVVLQSVPETHFNPFNGTTPIGFFSMFFTMMFGEALAPPYTQRLLIGRNARSTARGTVLSGLFSVPFFVITGLIGFVAYALGVTDQAASAMPNLVEAILPIGIRGIVMAAMVSIMLSAADGFLNGAAISLVCDTIVPLKPNLSDRTQLRLLRIINLSTGIAALIVAFAVPDVFGILVLAYSFWSPLIFIPLAASFLGIKSTGRAFRYALLTGFFCTIIWNFLLGKPYGIDGTVIGMLGNLIVFSWQTRKIKKYQTQEIRVWGQREKSRFGTP